MSVDGALLSEWVGAFFLGIGSLLTLIGGIGAIRFPDFFSRLHAAGVTDTGGAGLVLVGLMFYGGLTLVSVKLAMILFFLMMTSPTASHALAKAALSDGESPMVTDTESPPSNS